MTRDGRPAAVEGVGDVAGRASSFPEQAQDAPARGIGERAERPIRCHDVGMISQSANRCQVVYSPTGSSPYGPKQREDLDRHPREW